MQYLCGCNTFSLAIGNGGAVIPTLGVAAAENSISTVLVKVQQGEACSLQFSEANLLLGKSNVTKKYANEKTHKYVGLQNSGGSHIGYISHFVLGL